MSNVDIEIYFSQFKTFFLENPTELIKLIGNASERDFFNEVYSTIHDNHDSGDELQLTHKQIMDIVIKLNKIREVDNSYSDSQIFQKTKFGMFCLN
jgi:hypothetical protein